MKIAVIGAGSAVFSMNIVNDLCKIPGLQGTTVSLMDIDEERLDAVYALATKYSAELGAELFFEKTTQLEPALMEADYVINTAQVGGIAYLEKVRKISENYGYYRGIDAQELNMVSNYYTLSYFNQMKFFVDLVRAMEKLCPKAYLLLVSNPVFEGTNLIARCSTTRVVGFCHGYRGVFDLAKKLGLDPQRIDWQVAGFNHAIWLNRFLYDGKDAYQILDEWIEKHSCETRPTNPFDIQLSCAAIEMYKFYGLMPIGDTPRNTPWVYHFDLQSKKRWYGEPWGGPDSEIGRDWLYKELGTGVEMIKAFAKDSSFRFKDLKGILNSPLSKRLSLDLIKEIEILSSSEKLSEEGIVEFIDSIANGNPRRFVLNIPNEGYLPEFPEGIFVEVVAVVDKNGWHFEKIDPPLNEKIIKFYLLPRWIRMEWVVYAIMNGDKAALIEILLRDPRTKSIEQAKGVIDEILSLEENATMSKHYEKHLRL